MNQPQQVTQKNRPTFMGPEDPVAYDEWLRKKVQAALDDPRPSIPHAQAMALVRARIAQTRIDKGTPA